MSAQKVFNFFINFFIKSKNHGQLKNRQDNFLSLNFSWTPQKRTAKIIDEKAVVDPSVNLKNGNFPFLPVVIGDNIRTSELLWNLKFLINEILSQFIHKLIVCTFNQEFFK